jgi:hypothetical protein
MIGGVLGRSAKAKRFKEIRRKRGRNREIKQKKAQKKRRRSFTLARCERSLKNQKPKSRVENF